MLSLGLSLVTCRICTDMKFSSDSFVGWEDSDWDFGSDDAICIQGVLQIQTVSLKIQTPPPPKKIFNQN